MSTESGIKSGYDHYWNFHKDEKEFAEKGCPICIMKNEKREESDEGY